LTNDVVGLADSDADARWIGIRRHQAALIILGLGLVGGWLIESHWSSAALVLGLLALCGALPFADGLTLAEMGCVLGLYVSRRRWTSIRVEMRGTLLEIHARGAVCVRGFELHHRGRLDLSGLDLELADRFVELVKSFAARDDINHASVHVRSTPTSVDTLLVLRGNASSPEGWTENPELLGEFVGLGSGFASTGFLERWNYLRSDHEVLRTLRVRDFNSASNTRALLERLQQGHRHPDLSLQVDVVPGVKAQRIASRAVHQMGSDSAASSAVGFRRSARSKRSLRRLSQREELVASGEALLRLGVFLTVRAATRAQLRSLSKEVIRRAEESGLRVERGAGRQVLWHCFQLPGGPGW
jgi:hypothetical protein